MTTRNRPPVFIIITAARTGATWLGTSLNSHPEIAFLGEFYRARRRVLKSLGLPSPVAAAMQRHMPFVYIRFAQWRHRDAATIGFKLGLFDDTPFREQLLSAPLIPKILLHRRNLLAAFSSLAMAADSDHWRVEPGEVVKRSKIAFNARRFDRFCRNRSNFFADLRARFESSAQAYCDVAYEDLADAGQRQEILEFLGVDPTIELTSELPRQNTPHIIDRFSNPDDVRRHMAEIGRTEWLGEDDPYTDSAPPAAGAR